MKDIAVKILSHLSKNTLAMLVVILAGAVGRYWYADYSKGKNEIKSDMNELKKVVIDGFKQSEQRDKEISLDLGSLKGGYEIIKTTLPELKQVQVKQYEKLYEQIRQEQRMDVLKTDDNSYIQPAKPKDVSMLEPVQQPDSVKKKVPTDLLTKN